MSSLQSQLFMETASVTLNRLTKDLQKKFEPKKGDRFNVEGITYEIGPPKFVDADKAIRFEISSKIPGEELPESYESFQVFQADREAQRLGEKTRFRRHGEHRPRNARPGEERKRLREAHLSV